MLLGHMVRARSRPQISGLVLSQGISPSAPRLRLTPRHQRGKAEVAGVQRGWGRWSLCCCVALGKWLSLPEPGFFCKWASSVEYQAEVVKQAPATAQGLPCDAESLAPLSGPSLWTGSETGVGGREAQVIHHQAYPDLCGQQEGGRGLDSSRRLSSHKEGLCGGSRG